MLKIREGVKTRRKTRGEATAREAWMDGGREGVGRREVGEVL